VHYTIIAYEGPGYNHSALKSLVMSFSNGNTMALHIRPGGITLFTRYPVKTKSKERRWDIESLAEATAHYEIAIPSGIPPANGAGVVLYDIQTRKKKIVRGFFGGTWIEYIGKRQEDVEEPAINVSKLEEEARRFMNTGGETPIRPEDVFSK
jgi:hypothetical protein